MTGHAAISPKGILFLGAFTAFGLYLATTYRGPLRGKNELRGIYKDKQMGVDTKGMMKNIRETEEYTKNVVDETVNKIEKNAEKAADAIKKTLSGK